MKRFIVKADFSNRVKAFKAKKALLNNQFEEADIDLFLLNNQGNKSFKIERRSQAFTLAGQFFIFGALVGVLTYYFLLNTNYNDLLVSVQSGKIIDLLFVSAFSATAFFLLGYILGRRSFLHVLRFSDKNTAANGIVALDVAFDRKDEAIAEVKKFNPLNIDVLDSNFEVEVGLRKYS